MKKYLFISLIAFSFNVMEGQDIQFLNFSEAIGGEYQFPQNNFNCISAEQRTQINSVVHAASQVYRAKNGIQNMVTTFDWPVQNSTNSPYSDVWAISNFVDHNSAVPNQITDYNCGTRSYDLSDGYNHQGVDIFLWPFSWDMMDKEYAEVVAAAPGTIFFKEENQPDQSCAMGGGNWNAIYVVHADGSYALYGHMKKNSLTAKGVGDAVQTGEFLGIVGSSGNSTGPHLHFEVFDSSDNLIDPFAGSCNPLNNTSWWNNQMDYREENINAVMTHSAPPVFNPCPQMATINAKDAFAFGEDIYLAVYLKDQTTGSTINYTLKDGSGNVLNNWSNTFQDTYDASYWYYTISINDPGSGGIFDFVFEVSYAGQTESQAFQVGNLGIDEMDGQEIAVYPNPFQDEIRISGAQNFEAISVYDLSGKLIKAEKPETREHILNTTGLSSGIYFLKILDENGKESVKKIIKP